MTSVFKESVAEREAREREAAERDAKSIMPSNLKNTFSEGRYNKAFPRGTSPDAIVIGGGVAGLTAAAAMAKAGRRVLVLEQHDRCGGTLHTFVEKEVYEFDTGLHYVGNQLANSATLRYLTDGNVSFVPCDDGVDGRDNFDVAVVGHQRYEFGRGKVISSPISFLVEILHCFDDQWRGVTS
jgi:heterodisulfide reductase subunit A-like polyferredoxin